ncbi:MAG: bifunctional DNA-formamidopyrimidine glycosylase/DNA-(apurinic or apyrimidinic site) lyase [Alphaproteobacteria bacterium]|nr:bifunctional DNA-formamidopyrimidine glycosylase/DNA-(apurinic or apyrimidinic site) lyase [Beijerinckiaceae bacterium]NBQ38364.1 bifunctional DNA-formamidopyrimidine glycosylase/DNA-(apurinic or apyrimidinic site) lyase [Alphaproteobacteria bacterium]
MPELPEVETVRRGLEPAMAGQRLIAVEQRRKDLRFPFPARFKERLEGQRVTGLSRRAKYLVLHLSSEEALIMHLGMSGRFTVEMGDKTSKPGDFHYETTGTSPHDHIVFHMENGARITYNDPRRFGFMDLVPSASLSESKHFKAMGIEPLGNELDGELIQTLFTDKKAPLKAALLDQRLIAGLGNIYVCEALHRSGLSPKRLAGTLSGNRGLMKGKAELLATTIRDVLTEAVQAGGSSLRDYAQTDGSLGYFQHRFKVYGREGEKCPTGSCSGAIERIVQSGRSTFYCRTCQK